MPVNKEVLTNFFERWYDVKMQPLDPDARSAFDEAISHVPRGTQARSPANHHTANTGSPHLPSRTGRRQIESSGIGNCGAFRSP